MTATAPRPGFSTIFRRRNFRYLWLSQLISYIGDRGHEIALPVYVALATGSALKVGLVFAAMGLAHLLIGPVAGSVTDCWDRRRTMVAADLVRGAIVLSLPSLLAVDLAFAYLATFLLTAASLFFRPAWLSLIPDLVEEDELVQANSAFTITETVTDLGGMAAAGFLVALVGAMPVFYLDGATFIASALLIGLIRFRDQGRQGGLPHPARLIGDLKEGGTFLWNDVLLRANTALFVLGAACLGLFKALTPMLALSVLRAGPEGYGLLGAAMGFGALSGGILVGRCLAQRDKGPFILLGFMTMALATVGIGLSRTLVLAGAFFALAGLGNILFYILSVSLVQQRSPVRLRGRVFALRKLAIQAGIIVAASVGGLLGDGLGVPAAFVLGGSIVAVGTLTAAFVPAARVVSEKPATPALV